MSKTGQQHHTLVAGSEVDRYRIIRFLGAGGMGEVYLARDSLLGRKVALKLIHAESLGDQDTRSRFLREAQLTARFSHPHIVTLFGVGEHESAPYVALEYLDGQTLRERLQEERPGFREALRIGLAIVEGLAEAHHHDVQHRDLKPQNVMLPPDGRLRVLDFGLSRLVPEEDASPAAAQETAEEQPPVKLPSADAQEVATSKTLPAGGDPPSPATSEEAFRTQGNKLRGTPMYMAPELWRGHATGAPADIWALGMILHELFCGHHPYRECSFYQICYTVSDEQPVPSIGEIEPDLPPPLVALIDACLDKTPEARPTAPAIADILTELLDQGRKASSSSANPFRGLLPFGQRHAQRFFGRDTEIDAFLERLRDEPLLPVVGPSGAGKSSFVLAGVVPRLRENHPLRLLQLRPGFRPFENLAARLLHAESSSDSRSISHSSGSVSISSSGAHGDPAELALAETLKEQPTRLALHLLELAEETRSRVLLFVDQLEELYTLAPRADESTQRQQRFMEALCSAADDPEGPVRVVFTLRDDFLGRLAHGDSAQKALGRVVVLRPPGPPMLEQILTLPVTAAGYRFEDPTLVADIVKAVQNEPAALPLLQFAGQRLWEQRDRQSRTLTRAAYEKVGGVAGAMAQHADELLGGFTPEQEQIARRIFLRLVTPEGTRQVVPRSQLLADLGDDAKGVLERLTRERAVIVRKGRPEAELELVHESLIQAWDRLARWLAESRDERKFLAEVGQAAALWQRRGSPTEEVWHGAALTEALLKADRCQALPDPVQRFLDAGRSRTQRRLRRRRIAWGGLVLGSVLVAVAALIVSWVVSRKESEAQRQRRSAETQRRAALTQRATAQREAARAAQLRGNLLEARAKLRGALEDRDSVAARALWSRLRRQPLIWTKRLSAPVYSVAFSPDGRTVAAGSMDHAIYLCDVTTRRTRVLRGHTDQVFAVAFSPGGETLASATWSGEIRLWGLGGNRQVRVLRGHRAGVRALAFSPGGALLASASSDKSIRLWDVRTGREKARLTGHTAAVWNVAVSPDGRQVASVSRDNTTRLWDTRTGRQIRMLPGHNAGIKGLAFSPDGKTLATGSGDTTVRLWDLASGRHLATLRGHQSSVLSVVFSPDGKLLATTSADKTVRLWRVADRVQLAVHHAHAGAIWGAAFDPTGKLLATASKDGTIRLWKVDAARSGSSRSGHESAVLGVSFRPDGKRLATGGLDGTVRLWDVDTAAQLRVLRGHQAGVEGVAYNPKGTLLATSGADRTVRIWEMNTGRQRFALHGHRAMVYGVSFSSDGKLLATGSADRTVRLWDVVKGRQRAVLRGHKTGVWGVSFQPGGKLLASASSDKTVRIWDTSTGKSRPPLRGHTAVIRGVAFSPDGAHLASGSRDGTVRLWDLRRQTATVLGRAPGRIYFVDFHPDGQRVGAPCSDGTARILDRRPGRSFVLTGHQGEVNYLRFSPRGRTVATTSDDGTVRLWNTATGRPVWRAPLLRARRPLLFTHRGWVKLDHSGSRPAPPIKTRWSRRISKAARRAAESTDGRLLCIATYEDQLEMWDLQEDRLLQRHPLTDLRRVVALRRGCVTLAGGSVRLHPAHAAAGASTKTLMQGAIAIARDREDLLVATTKGVHVLDAAGTPLQRYRADSGVTAMARAGRYLVLGFRNGGIELVPTARSPKRPTYTFESTPASPVVRLLPGPGETLIAGFGNGLYGLWDLRNGQQLDQDRIHGPVVHLQLRGSKLYVASELGLHTVRDLGVFHLPYCALLRQIWSQVKVAWENGLPIERATPEHHRCALPAPVQH